jgi:hypothetical protein
MPQIGVDPATGRLTLDGQVLDRNDPRLWGISGANVIDASTGDASTMGAGAYDPRYYEAYTINMGDAGEQTGYRLRPEVQQRLGDQIQLGQSGVGGHAEINDPTQATYDPEFGILTGRGNVNAPDDSGIQGIMADYVIPYATMAAIGMGAGGMMGVGPLAGVGTDAAGVAGVDAAAYGGELASVGETGGTMLGGAAPVSVDVISGLAGAPLDASTAFGAGGLAPEEMGIANYEAGAGIPGASGGSSLFRSAADFARDLLGGGGNGTGAAGRGSILGGFGAAPRIGDHKTDSDPYGLMASGYGPWQGILPDDPKAKVAAALAKKTNVNPWG